MRPLLLALLILSFGTPAVAEDDNELVILMLVDALRPDHMGAYGYKRPTTPTMDGLAASGRRFTKVYANAPWTRPSTASFLTGLNASRHQTETYKTRLPADVPTLAEAFQKAGWTTAGFVANGNGGSLAGLEKGFDVFRDPTNTYDKKTRGKTWNGLPTGMFMVDKTLTWLKKTPGKTFLFMFLVDPHDPYAAPPAYEKKFLGDYKGKIRRNTLWETNNDYPPGEQRSLLAVYDASILYADDAIKKFVAGLKAQGRWDKTHLLITADHGEGFGEHGFYLHAHHFWDEVVRIPLIAVGPKFEVGVDHRLTDSLDIAATLADLTGVPVPNLPGQSLLTQKISEYTQDGRHLPAEAVPNAAPEPVISEYNEFGIHRQMITDGRYKVVWQRPADEAWYMREAKKKSYFPSVSFDREVIHVFDLKADPGEKKNIAQKMPKKAKALLQQLRRFVEQAPGG